VRDYDLVVVGVRLWTRMIGLYRRLEERHARLQETKANLGVGGFLSGHDGWYYHPSTPKPPAPRD